ncbi:MAG: CoA-transferase [Gemmatimonas sp. SG8_23]|jgi:crotonobetainyl-CoA:carnitine CoA-transferase CaiB-like acyl-CoA transferase|nr:MAG: CoA-transferase [Gemmatimonas sp. SG8_23]
MSNGSPLEGVRVVELAHIMAGPVCGLLLADMGADVVKVERLPRGDATRGFLPPSVDGESAAFMMLNRGKRGVALDLRSPEGVDVVRRLLAQADVVIENFRVGTMERMGLGWEALAQVNPRLVYCQITGFGRTGPMSERGGFDLIAQGHSGLMSITGEGPGRAPVKVGAPVTDITAGILAAFGVVSALFERERTGEGRLVDTSLFEAGITQTYWQSAIALASGVSPGPLGSAHPLAAPYQAFRTADGWINVGASNPRTWKGLTRVIGKPSLAEDPRFAENAGRMAHLDDLVEVLEPYFRRRSTDEWLVRLVAEGVPAGPIASVGEMLEHPQTLAREMVIEVEHSALGPVRSLGRPVKLHRARSETAGPHPEAASDRPAGARGRGAPLFGEHTREVLEGYGLEPSEVELLLADGIALEAR